VRTIGKQKQNDCPRKSGVKKSVGQTMENALTIALIPAVVLGTLNGFYWRKQGYRGWHLFYLGFMAFYALSVMILKKM
jgi:hypothetical protein